MKSQSLKKPKLLFLYIIIGLILVVLCVLNILYGPKNVSSKVKTKDIAYIVINEPGFYGVTTNIDEDIKTLKKLLNKAIYYRTFKNDYRWGTDISIEVYYDDGSKIFFGPHRIVFNDVRIDVYYTNFDFETMYEIAYNH